MGFWDDVNHALAEARQANTADELIAALNRWDTSDRLKGGGEDAFFAGSGGDDQLVESLNRHWKVHYIEGDYHWQALSQVDGSAIEYIEGDVYKRDSLKENRG